MISLQAAQPKRWESNNRTKVEAPISVLKFIKAKGIETWQGAQSLRIDVSCGSVKVHIAKPADLKPDPPSPSPEQIALINHITAKLSELPIPKVAYKTHNGWTSQSFSFQTNPDQHIHSRRIWRSLRTNFQSQWMSPKSGVSWTMMTTLILTR